MTSFEDVDKPILYFSFQQQFPTQKNGSRAKLLQKSNFKAKIFIRLSLT